MNSPTKITFGTTGTIEYLYDANGKKLEKLVTQGTVATTTKYLEGFQYTNDVLNYFPTTEGYVGKTGSSYKYVFNYTDHLGNIRLSYAKNPITGLLEILEENNYYPFGLKHNPSTVVNLQPNYKYKYNGKELQDELGLNVYDYGARNYDPALGRWMNIDPLAEQYRRWSPYNYCVDNPIYFTDPDGMSILPTFQDDNTKKSYISTAENATGNTYKVTSDPFINRGKIEFSQVVAGPVTQEQQAFIDVYKEAVDSPSVANVEIVSNDKNVTVGDIIDNKIDIADIAEFDKAGSGVASSAGALAHETKEQQVKAEAGEVKGSYPKGASSMHRQATNSENRVNGNIRVEDPVNGTNTFYEKDKTKTSQTVTPNTSTGGIIVNKTKIP